ncbi:choice-of-anchor J domain-containing protein [Prevotella dentasini]
MRKKITRELRRAGTVLAFLTAGVVAAQAQEMLLSESFDTADGLKNFIVLDNNKDDVTWNWIENEKNVAVYAGEKGNDDWLLTPALHLKANYIYTLSFRAKRYYASYVEEYSVHLGEGDDPTAYKLLKNMPSPDVESKLQQMQIKPDKDMTARIGFHCTSKHGSAIYLDDISVDQGSLAAAPDSVYNLRITPYPKGKLNTTIKFNCPQQTIGGSTLTSLSKIAVYCGEREVAIIDNPVPGKELTVEDTSADGIVNGFNTYRVIAYNAEGMGCAATKQVWVGFDVPANPANVKIVDAGDHLSLTWDIPEMGEHGGYVDATKCVNEIFRLRDDVQSYKSKYEGTSIDIPIDSDKGHQGWECWGVSTTNEYGTCNSMGFSNYIPTGESYKLPFNDPMAGGLKYDSWWSLHRGKGNSGFEFTDNPSYNDDRGAFVAQIPDKNGESYLMSGKIDIRNAKKPKLYFHYYGIPGQDAKLLVEIDKAMNETVVMKTIDFSENVEMDWQRAEIDLSGIGDSRYIVVKFHVLPGDFCIVGIDNVVVMDELDINLGAEISAPKSIMAGEQGNIGVTIMNTGSKSVEKYTTKLYVNGELQESRASSHPLKSMESAVETFAYKMPINAGETVTAYAVVETEGDENRDNDKTGECVINVLKPDCPTPAGLAATAVDGANVLTWNSPVLPEPEETTEDFETYDMLTANFGEWDIFDGDKGVTYWFDNIPWDGANKPYAWLVINPYDMNIDVENSPQITPHSGNQFAGNFSAGSDYTAIGHNDDWLISPILPRIAQKVSFYAAQLTSEYGIDQLVVLYSATGRNIESFIPVDTIQISAVPTGKGEGWQKVEVSLPENSKYFAIRNISKDTYLCMVDDISFTKGFGEKITGYNVYRDGKFVGRTEGNVTTYKDTPENGLEHDYNVTALYGSLESLFSNTASVTTGIEEIVSADMPLVIYTVNGVRVNTSDLKSLPKGIYIVNGKKMVVR